MKAAGEAKRVDLSKLLRPAPRSLQTRERGRNNRHRSVVERRTMQVAIRSRTASPSAPDGMDMFGEALLVANTYSDTSR